MWFSQCLPTPHGQSLPSPASVQLAINSFILILKVAYSRLLFVQLCWEVNFDWPENPIRFLGGNTSGVSSHSLLDPESSQWEHRWSVMLWAPKTAILCVTSAFSMELGKVTVLHHEYDSQLDHRDKMWFDVQVYLLVSLVFLCISTEQLVGFLSKFS